LDEGINDLEVINPDISRHCTFFRNNTKQKSNGSSNGTKLFRTNLNSIIANAIKLPSPFSYLKMRKVKRKKKKGQRDLSSIDITNTTLN
jgi:hypothetical protein